jgi:hypothetical protein
LFESCDTTSPEPETLEISMITLKTINAATAVWSLALMTVPLAHAQGQTTATGFTDIYSTDFQQVFKTDRADPRAPVAATSAGSADIYATDFQRPFGADASMRRVPDTAAYRGSTDIYTTNFQETPPVMLKAREPKPALRTNGIRAVSRWRGFQVEAL